MSYIYISSGYFGSQVLSALPKKPVLIITQPDRMGGRGMKTLISTPVKKMAQEMDIAFIEVNNKEELINLVKTNGDKVILLSDFGMIVPEAALKASQWGIWNIHPSLLPLYRGATPIQTAIINGEQMTGVSIIQMDALVDHGPVLAQQKLDIDINDTTITFMQKAAKVASDLFTKLAMHPEATLTDKKIQLHEKATFTQKLNKEDGYVELEKIVSYLEPIIKKYNLAHLLPTTSEKQIDQKILHNKIRGLSPWPGVWTKLPHEKVLKIISSHRKDAHLVIKKIQIDSKIYEFDTMDYS